MTARRPQTWSFQEAVEQTPHLRHAWKVGLPALRKEDRPHIDAEDTRKLTGRVDVDTPLAKIYPHAHRWDFGIAYQHTDREEEVVYWTELHTASDSEVKVVIAKAEGLLAWLKSDGNRLARFESEIVWISSGATTFTLGSPQKSRWRWPG